MSITTILFILLSVMAVGSALMVITRKNPVHSVLYLIVTFFAISGHYILLNAQFLAIVNIIVYAGAIMVLFLFVVMMMNLNIAAEPQKNKLIQLAGLISGGSLLLVMLAATIKSKSITADVQMQVGDYGLIKTLGKVLFNDYVVPFELSSVLFLSAMIGAVVMSKKES
jgi:NADH-quinone oxidoreductase subunit J